jgi:nitroreductase/NAD-dependent dihydropyrimidine dehydrogenase PreA subunit
MALLEVNKETCTKCGTCAATCPGGIILFFKDKYPRPVSAAEEFCLRCGHCVGICPTGSMTHAEIPVEQCPPIEDSLKISIEQCAQLIKSRRSIRKYRDKPVPREDIVRLIDIARYAPTGHNAQEIRWLVIDDKEKLQSFEKIGLDWMHDMSRRSPEMAPMLEGVIKRMESGRPDFLRAAPAVVVAHAEKDNSIASIDAPIALGYFDLAASSLGLGCCWAGFFMMSANTFPAMVEAVALPGDQQVYGALMLGYPKYRHRRVPVRKPAQITWQP